MRAVLISVLAAGALFGQPAGKLAGRIISAPLSSDQRQAVTDAYSRKDYPRIESALASSPTAELQSLLGALEFVGGRFAQAAAAFKLSDTLQPLDDEDRFTLAMSLVNLKDLEGARAQLTRLNLRRPDQPLYLYWLARLDYGQRRYDDGVVKLRRVVKLDPESVRGYDNLGLCYDMMGFEEQAREAFLKAVVLNRKQAAPSAWPPHNLGYLLLRAQRQREAEEYLREALKYDPNFALCHYHLGRVLEDQEKNDEAIREYRLAAAEDEKLAVPLYSLGLLYRRQERAAEAAQALTEFKRRKAMWGDSQ